MAKRAQVQCWQVAGLDCPSCVAVLERACATVPGVVTAKAVLATGRLEVEVDDAAFESAALLAAARGVGHPLSREGETAPAQPWWPVALAGAAVAVGLGLELAGWSSRGCYLVAALLGAVPVWPRALGALRQRTLDIDALMVLALAGALALGDWREAAVLGVLFAVAEALEHASLGRAGAAVESLLALAPRTARVERGDEVREVPAESVRVGERLRVRPGDLVALDGTIVAGRSALDEASVTGESVPADKGPGDTVYAATLALDGALTVEVTRPFADSTIARVARLVEEAQAAASPLQRQVDRFARWYTPAIVGLAALVAVVPPLVVGGFATWFYRALVLLLLGCPCAIVIATPVAITSGLTAAARRGLLVRGGAVLEALADVRAVAFDKTGTLTTGRPRLREVVPLAAETSEAELLALAAGLEADSAHPLAHALLAACRERGLVPATVADHRVEPGRGVTGTIAGEHYRLGNAALVPAAAHAELEQRGLTLVALANTQPLALFGLSDAPRAEAVEALAQLRAAGVTDLAMLTGDRRAAAEAMAGQLGLSEVHAELLPGDKQTVLAALEQRWGPLAMVGDGLNDAPALASARVGIAFGTASSPVATESAAVAVLGDDLRALAGLFALARRVRGTIRANIALALAIRLALVPLALSGHAALWVAIVCDVGGSLAVTGNSLRLLR